MGESPDAGRWRLLDGIAVGVALTSGDDLLRLLLE
jgi:hypothetical protein